MGIFDRKFGPVVLKESSGTEEYIAKLQELSAEASGKWKTDIENDIRYAIYGLSGEKSIAYELRNKDDAMEQLVRQRPASREELTNISGFGEKNVQKYGDTILVIIKTGHYESYIENDRELC